MPKIDITRTELVWPGKYDEEGNLVPVERVNLPFQVIETVNETRATREAKTPQLTFFDYWQPQEGDTFEEGWKNKLIWGDNKYVMSSLLAQGFAGKIDLIYIDPPFAIGADFSCTVEVGDTEVTKTQSAIEEKAYRDTWGSGNDSFLHMLYERLQLMRDLLSDRGLLFLHVGQNISGHIRVMLDEIFGPGNFRNQVIWKRTFAHGNVGQGTKHLGPLHDVIFLYARSEDHISGIRCLQSIAKTTYKSSTSILTKMAVNIA